MKHLGVNIGTLKSDFKVRDQAIVLIGGIFKVSLDKKIFTCR
jgi:hypothetical protein